MAMIVLIRLALAIVASLFKSRARLEAENAALRQQLIVLRRKLPGRVELKNGLGCSLVGCTGYFPRSPAPCCSFGRRRLCVGTGRAFGSIGAGNRAAG